MSANFSSYILKQETDFTMTNNTIISRVRSVTDSTTTCDDTRIYLRCNVKRKCHDQEF